MIIGHKQRFFQRPHPAYEFDKFLKIRSQKQSIIQSQQQPITQKIQGFQQLLKLTKTGSSICTPNINKRHTNSQLKNKMQASKTINIIGSTNNQYQFAKFQEIESDETQMKKLNKMVSGITEWQFDRQKQSFHVQQKIRDCKTSKGENRINLQSKKQKTSKQQNQQRKLYSYTSSDGKKFRKFYSPMRKNQAQGQLNRINSQFIKTSAHLNYPKQLLKNNLFGQQEQNFKDLRNKIKQLQNKAKKEYGLKFQHEPLTKKVHIFSINESKADSDEKQNEEMEFMDLELGPILANQFPNRYKNYQKMLEEENINCADSSIPKNLINVIKRKGDSYHQFSLPNTKFEFEDISSKSNMKKKYKYRPKTFKPSYTYVRI